MHSPGTWGCPGVVPFPSRNRHGRYAVTIVTVLVTVGIYRRHAERRYLNCANSDEWRCDGVTV